MSIWDKTTPLGSDPKSQGDDRIRELKAALEDALKKEGVFPGPNPSTTPVFKWTGKRGNTASRPASPDTGEIYFNTQIPQLEYWNGSAWTGYDLLPANGVDNSKIANASIAVAKLSDYLVPNSVTGGAIQNGSVSDAKITDVAFSKITGTITPSDGTVTSAKLASGIIKSIGNTTLVAGPSVSQDDGLVTLVNYSGSGLFLGLGVTTGGVSGGFGGTGTFTLIIDGVTYTKTQAVDNGITVDFTMSVAHAGITLTNSAIGISMGFRSTLVVKLQIAGAGDGRNNLMPYVYYQYAS